jgi:hypothetical protein
LSLGEGPHALPRAGSALGAELSTAKDPATSTVDSTVGGADEPVVDGGDAGPNNEAGPQAVAGSGATPTPTPTSAPAPAPAPAATATARRSSEKTSGSRASRRTAASAA